MKKYTILGLALALCGALLVGCGCMNTDTGTTSAPSTLPTNGEPSRATTEATTMPTTAATTAPTTEAATENGILPDMDATGDTTDNTDVIPDGATEETGGERSRSRRIPPMG